MFKRLGSIPDSEDAPPIFEAAVPPARHRRSGDYGKGGARDNGSATPSQANTGDHRPPRGPSGLQGISVREGPAGPPKPQRQNRRR